MIKSVTVTNYLGDSLKMELARPELSGFAIISMDGLGPGTSNINTTEISTGDGSIYNSSRVDSRNITLSMIYLWLDSIEDARHRSYKYFPIKQKIKLTIETDSRLLEIEGYVESNEPAIFSSLEGTEISIICPYPFFYSGYGDQTTVFSGIEPMFEFPFSNESLRGDLLNMGEIQNLTENVVTYQGDVEVGVVIRIHAMDEARNIAIYNLKTREIMRIDTDKIEAFTGEKIHAGDDIIISTVQGAKSMTLIRDGIETNILNCMARDTDWFTLAKGDNIFTYTAEFGSTNLQFRIENKLAFEGV